MQCNGTKNIAFGPASALRPPRRPGSGRLQAGQGAGQARPNGLGWLVTTLRVGTPARLPGAPQPPLKVSLPVSQGTQEPAPNHRRLTCPNLECTLPVPPPRPPTTTGPTGPPHLYSPSGRRPMPPTTRPFQSRRLQPELDQLFSPTP